MSKSKAQSNSWQQPVSAVLSLSIEKIEKDLTNYLTAKGFQAKTHMPFSQNEAILKVEKKRKKCYIHISSSTDTAHLTKFLILTPEELPETNPSILSFLKTSKKTQQSKEQGNVWRAYWIVFLLAGVILSILLRFADFVDRLKAKYGTEEILFFYGSIMALIFFIFIYGPAIYHNWKKKRIEEIGKEIHGLIQEFIQQEKSTQNRSELKCWNCFRKVDVTDSFCSHCGANL